jgi:hypothetical protein
MWCHDIFSLTFSIIIILHRFQLFIYLLFSSLLQCFLVTAVKIYDVSFCGSTLWMFVIFSQLAMDFCCMMMVKWNRHSFQLHIERQLRLWSFVQYIPFAHIWTSTTKKTCNSLHKCYNMKWTLVKDRQVGLLKYHDNYSNSRVQSMQNKLIFIISLFCCYCSWRMLGFT